MPAKDSSSRIKVALHAHQQATDPLDKLKMSRTIRVAAEELEADAIEQARNSGATWREIGSCYGVTKQGAQQRFRTAPRNERTKHKKSARGSDSAP